jgi:hypothetical protein
MTTTGTKPGDGARVQIDLARLREDMATASEAVEELRVVLTRIAQVEAELRPYQERLPDVIALVDRARREERNLDRLIPDKIRYSLPGRLGIERERRADLFREALVEQLELDTRIAERTERLRALRARAAELRPRAVALPRLLDEVADCLYRLGGPAADELRAAEAGLDPASRREADLDRAVRWIDWAGRQIDRSMQRLGRGRTFTEYDGYFEGAGGSGLEEMPLRVRAAREALTGVREVLDTVTAALAELGVHNEDLESCDLPEDVDGLFAEMIDPRGETAERITRILAECERLPRILDDLGERIRGDHRATLRVVQERRARWSSILRGE